MHTSREEKVASLVGVEDALDISFYVFLYQLCLQRSKGASKYQGSHLVMALVVSKQGQLADCSHRGLHHRTGCH